MIDYIGIVNSLRNHVENKNDLFIPFSLVKNDLVDAANAIEQLVNDIEIVTKERDSLLEDVNGYQGMICNYCIRKNTEVCIFDKLDLGEAPLSCGMFKWRGVGKHHAPIIIEYKENPDDSVFIMSNN